MAVNAYVGVGSAPVQSPLLQPGSSFAAVAWAAWFSALGLRVNQLPMIQDTRANRANYAAARYLWFLYYETDRGLIYAAGMVANTPTWFYVAGEMVDTFANRPVAGTLTANDKGLLFLAKDTLAIYEWDGAAWQYYGGSKASASFNPITDSTYDLGDGVTPLRWRNGNFAGLIDNLGTVRSTGQVNPAAGSGAELVFAAGVGYLQAFNRTAGVYLPLTIQGNPLNLATPIQVGGVNTVSGTISLAKLTSTGANGSITVNNGLITAFTNPT